MPFSKKSLSFLEENHRRNSREWFAEYKEEYKQHVEGPMLELAAALAPTVLDIDPLITAEPKRTVSKIWRDTRFARDKSAFKRASWMVFRRGKGMEYPVFFFEFTPDFYRYGCGYYSAPPAVMNIIREQILDGDKLFQKAQKALKALPGFNLEGDLFKRPRYPQADKALSPWLERKNLSIMRTVNDSSFLDFDLVEELRNCFITLTPFYEMLVRAHQRHVMVQEESRLAAIGYTDFDF